MADPDLPQNILQDYFGELLYDQEKQCDDDYVQPSEHAKTETIERENDMERADLTQEGATVSQTISPDVAQPIIQSQHHVTETIIPTAGDYAELESKKRDKLQALLQVVTVEPEALETSPESKHTVDAVERHPEHDSIPADETIDLMSSRYLGWNENGRPDWAQNDFDALVFSVGQLKLAAPLIALGNIHAFEESALKAKYSKDSYFMGVLPLKEGYLEVIDTQKFVLGERYNPEQVTDKKYVLSLDGVRFALAVQRIDQPVRIAHEDVNWRTQRTRRPWLAGTVRSKMCALLDITQLDEILDQHSKNIC